MSNYSSIPNLSYNMKKSSLTWHKPLQGAVVALLLCTCNSETPPILSMQGQGVEEAQASSGAAAPPTSSSLQTPPSSVSSGQALGLPQEHKHLPRLTISLATTSHEVATRFRKLTKDFERIKRRQKVGGEERKEYYDSLAKDLEVLQKQLAALSTQLTDVTTMGQAQQALSKEMEELSAQVLAEQQDTRQKIRKFTEVLEHVNTAQQDLKAQVAKSSQAYQASLAALWERVEIGELTTRIEIQEALSQQQIAFQQQLEEQAARTRQLIVSQIERLNKSFDAALSNALASQQAAGEREAYSAAVQRYRETVYQGLQVAYENGIRLYGVGCTKAKRGVKNQVKKDYKEAAEEYRDAVASLAEARFYLEQALRDKPVFLKGDIPIFKQIGQGLVVVMNASMQISSQLAKIAEPQTVLPERKSAKLLLATKPSP